MILTLDEILKEVKFDQLLDEFQVNPMSIDLRLAEDVWLSTEVSKHAIGKSLESMKLPADVMGVVYPRSSTNRRFITLDMTGVVDPGYDGPLILPFTNWGDSEITLKKGERVASIIFYRVSKPVQVRLSKYHKGDGSYKPDKKEEAGFIERGDLDGLKAKYQLGSE